MTTSENALNTSGRLRVTVANPSLSTLHSTMFLASSAAADVEQRRFEGGANWDKRKAGALETTRCSIRCGWGPPLVGWSLILGDVTRNYVWSAACFRHGSLWQWNPCQRTRTKRLEWCQYRARCAPQIPVVRFRCWVGRRCGLPLGDCFVFSHVLRFQQPCPLASRSKAVYPSVERSRSDVVPHSPAYLGRKRRCLDDGCCCS
jgi:hypothetical protein